MASCDQRDGFFIVPDFAAGSVCEAMHARAVELAREADGAGMAGASFVQPLPKGGLAAVMGATGIEGSRLGSTLLTFVSGAGYPDYVVFSARVLLKGDDAVLAAGFLDHR